jgi:hypothetical protein
LEVLTEFLNPMAPVGVDVLGNPRFLAQTTAKTGTLPVSVQGCLTWIAGNETGDGSEEPASMAHLSVVVSSCPVELPGNALSFLLLVGV